MSLFQYALDRPRVLGIRPSGLVLRQGPSRIFPVA